VGPVDPARAEAKGKVAAGKVEGRVEDKVEDRDGAVKAGQDLGQAASASVPHAVRQFRTSKVYPVTKPCARIVAHQ
jgi:hypothetical protein